MTRLAVALTAALTPFAVQAAHTGWPLTLVDGQTPGFTATLALDQPGKVHGRAPCNRYSGSLTATLPAFRVEAVISTKMACADMAAEQRFFDLLDQMDHAEQVGDVLTLTGAGHEMVFSSRP